MGLYLYDIKCIATAVANELEKRRPVPSVEKVALAICRASPHTQGTCAAICMDELGDVPKKGCRHAVDVHGRKARAAMEAMNETS